MAIPQKHDLLVLWAVVSLFTSSAHAEVFTYRHGAEHFQAVVSDNQLTVKERYQGASTVYGDLSCPLGGAVKANRIADSKLCLTFSKDTCRYSRYQNGTPVHNEELANARVPKMCIVLASDKDARRFVSLVNTGLSPAQQPPVATGATADRTHSTVAGPDASQPVREVAPTAVAVNQQPPAALEARESESRTTLPPKSQAAKVAPLPQKEQKLPAGKWATGSFTVGLSGNTRMKERTYANASIVNKTGAPRRPGGYILIRNTSDKYPLYYGLHKQARYKLDAGEQVTIPLGPTGAQRRARVSQQVVIRWLQEPEGVRSAAAVKTGVRKPQGKAAAKGSPAPRPPTTVNGRTVTVHSGDTTPEHRVAARVE